MRWKRLWCGAMLSKEVGQEARSGGRRCLVDELETECMHLSCQRSLQKCVDGHAHWSVAASKKPYARGPFPVVAACWLATNRPTRSQSARSSDGSEPSRSSGMRGAANRALGEGRVPRALPPSRPTTCPK